MDGLNKQWMAYWIVIGCTCGLWIDGMAEMNK